MRYNRNNPKIQKKVVDNMSISEKIEKYYSNQVKNIKNLKGKEKLRNIKALYLDLGKNSINAISTAVGCCWRTVKKAAVMNFLEVPAQKETRGRKSIMDKYPKLVSDIEEIINSYKSTDPHFRTEKLYVNITPQKVVDELITNYNYTKEDFSARTIKRIIKGLGYKLKKVEKTEVVKKIAETDEIFKNVNEKMNELKDSDNSIEGVSIDDKARKRIGKLSEGGKSLISKRAFDHDTEYECSIDLFGILDLKTDKLMTFGTKGSSTSDFKADGLEKYIIIKKEENPNFKKLLIFLDNGMDNSSVRKQWKKRIQQLATQYDIEIELVYYPPYHSKYNKIERCWARITLSWLGLIITSVQMLIGVLENITWKGNKIEVFYVEKQYDKGISPSDEEMQKIDENIIRKKGIEKWSLTFKPCI